MMPMKAITLSLPGDTSMAAPGDPDRWERRDGRIVASYTREELTLAVWLALDQKREWLEDRLTRGMAVLQAATGQGEDEAERLLAHWDALTVEYGATLAALATLTSVHMSRQSLVSENVG